MTTDTPFDGWPDELVALPDHLTLNVRAAPAAEDAQPAVLVHGLGGSSLNWTALMGLMGDRLDSRAPDLPGFGHSPPPHDGDYSLGGHARAVIYLIESAGRGPVHLFGNSMGGAIATTVAADRPDLVRTLTLVSPALPDLAPGRWRSQVVLLAAPGLGPLVARKVAELSPQKRVDALIELCFAEPGAVPDEWRAAAERDVAARQRLPYGPDAVVRSTHGIVRAYLDRSKNSLWAKASRVEAPTLLVYGNQDRLVRPAMAARAKNTFRNSQAVILPATGHVAQIERPAVVARLVGEHLDRYARSAVAG